MKITYRPGCFETNSSSVHALVSLSPELMEAWKKKGFLCLTAILDDSGQHGAFYMTEPIEASDADIVDADEYDRAQAEVGWVLDDEDVIGETEIIPYSFLESSDPYVSRMIDVSKGEDGHCIVSLDYDGWRD